MIDLVEIEIKEADRLMIINVPDKVEYIINELKTHGYEAYAVGGCVRDSILGRTPGDWDITTSASPYEVKDIFHRTIDTGIQHGTVTVMLDKEGFEVTTYRVDGEYEDCRHPKQVEFTKSLEEDLKRRDFTINAMAYNNEDGMVDLFEGLKDINEKRIRCVGKAEDRFEEDALRILRAVRFSAQIDFQIEEETTRAIVKKAKNLKNISAERIREEINKLFLSNYPRKLLIAYETGITNVVLPEFNHKKSSIIRIEDKEYNYGDYVLDELQCISNIGRDMQNMYDDTTKMFIARELTNKEKLCLSYAVVLEDVNNHELQDNMDVVQAKKVMLRLKFDNETIYYVSKLVGYCNTIIADDDISVRQAMNTMGTDLMDLWFILQRVRIKACMDNSQKLKNIHDIYIRYCRIRQAGECVNLKGLYINGKDLIELGCKPGVALGEILDQLLKHVLLVPEDNEKEKLKILALQMI